MFLLNEVVVFFIVWCINVKDSKGFSIDSKIKDHVFTTFIYSKKLKQNDYVHRFH